MNKTSGTKITMAAAILALAASSGIFAQEKTEHKRPELPDTAKLKKYHDSILDAFTEIEKAKVEAGVLSQEWADAQIALLKAVQSDCKGQCIIEKRDHLTPPRPHNPDKMKMHNGGKHKDPKHRKAHGPKPEHKMNKEAVAE